MSNQEILNAIQDSDRLEALRMTGLLDTGADEAFDRLTRLAAQITGAPVAFVSLVDEDYQFVKSCAGIGDPFGDSRRMPLSYSFCKHTVAESTPVVVEDTSRDVRVQNNPARDEYDIQAYVGVPLTTSDGYTLGSFCVIDHEPSEWSDEDISALRDLAAFTITEIELRADLIRRKALESELKYRANHDTLTELANRDLLWKRLGEAIERADRTETRLAVLYLDLDHFKAINDNFGHVVGDQLLQVVARRLESKVRDTDTLARIGGDEFVAVLEGVQHRKRVDDIAERIARSLSESFQVDDHTVDIGVSIGIVLYEPGASKASSHTDPQDLIQWADAAMYRAKAHDTKIEYGHFHEDESPPEP